MAVSIVPGLMTLTLIFPLSSAVQVRAKERTAALLALYTLVPGNPLTPAIELFRMIDEALLGNGAKWLTELTIAGASKEDVNATLLVFDYGEQTI